MTAKGAERPRRKQSARSRPSGRKAGSSRHARRPRPSPAAASGGLPAHLPQRPHAPMSPAPLPRQLPTACPQPHLWTHAVGAVAVVCTAKQNDSTSNARDTIWQQYPGVVRTGTSPATPSDRSSRQPIAKARMYYFFFFRNLGLRQAEFCLTIMFRQTITWTNLFWRLSSIPACVKESAPVLHSPLTDPTAHCTTEPLLVIRTALC